MADLILSGPISAPASRWRSALARGGARLWIGGVLVALLLLIALFAPVIAPHDPAEQDLMSAQLPPAFMRGGEAAFPLGTDSLGRCVLSRLMYSAPRCSPRSSASRSASSLAPSAASLISRSRG